MAIRTLSLKLDLDAGTFSVSAKSAAGAMKELTRAIDDGNRAAKLGAESLDGTVRGIKAYVENGTRMKKTADELRNAQDQFVSSLKRELDMLNLGKVGVRDLNASLLGLTEQTEDIRKAIDDKRQAMAAATEADRKATAAAREAALAEKSRLDDVEKLMTALHERTVVLRGGAEALEADRAAALGVGDAYEVMRGLLDSLNAQHREAEAVMSALAETDRLYAEALAEDVSRTRALEEASAGLTNSLREQLLVLREGADALTLEKAATLGVEEETRRLLEAINQAKAGEVQAAEVERELANARRASASATKTQAQASEALRADITRQIAALKLQAIAQTGGAAAVAEYRAQQAGASREMAPLIAQLRALQGEFGGVERSAHSSGRAIYELNVLTHELSSGRIRQAISSFSILLNSIGLAGGAVLGLTLTIGVLYGLSKPIEEAAKHFEELKHQSEELGISVRTLQTLGVAAQELGIKTDKVVNGMGRLDQTFARARAGSKQAQDGFNALGVDITKNFTQEGLFKAVLQGFDKIADGPRKVTVATELFGRSGKDLIPVLNELARNYDALDRKADAYGIHNDKAVEVGSRLAESFRDAGLASQGFGNTLLVATGPALLAIVDGFRKTTQAIGDFLKDGQTISVIFDGLKTVAIGLATYFAVDFVAGIAAAGGVFTELAFALFTFSFGTIPAAIAALRSLALAMVTNPAVLLTGAVVGLVLVLNRFKETTDAAVHAQDNFRKAQNDALSPLASALDFAQKYGGATGDLTKSINQLTGATAAGSGKTDAATTAAIARANAEKLLTVELLRRAAAEAGDNARKASDSVNGFGGLKTQNQLDEVDNFFHVGGSKGFQERAQRIAARNAQTRDALAAAKQGLDLQKQLSKAADDTNNIKLDSTTVKVAASGNGTTEGDPSGKAKGAKNDRGTTVLDDLKAQAAGLAAQLEDGDTTVAKYTERMNNLSDPIGQAVAKHKELREAILAAAQAIDDTKKQIDAKKSYDQLADDAKKQHEALKQATEDFALQIAGTDAASRANARYSASVRELAEKSKLYDPKAHGKDQTAADLAKGADADHRGLEDVTQAASAYTELTKRETEAKSKAQELWDQYANGAQKAMTPIAKLRGELSAMVAEIRKASKDPHAGDAAQSVMDEIISKTNAADTTAALIDIRSKTKAVNAELAQDATQKARQAVQAEIDSYAERIKLNTLYGADRMKAEADFTAFVQSENEKLARDIETPAQKMVRAWENTTERMKDLQGQWLSGFYDVMKNGGKGWQDFVTKMLSDYVWMLIQAKTAKQVNGALDAFTNFLTGTIGGFFGMTPGAQNLGAIQNPTFEAASYTPNFVTVGGNHGGGIIGSEHTFMRSVASSIFDDAKRYHSGGIPGLKADEQATILQKGEGVFTKGQMAAMGQQTKSGQTAPNVSINLINQSGQDVEAQHQGTSFDGEKFVIDTVVTAMNKRGALRDAMRGR